MNKYTRVEKFSNEQFTLVLCLSVQTHKYFQQNRNPIRRRANQSTHPYCVVSIWLPTTTNEEKKGERKEKIRKSRKIQTIGTGRGGVSLLPVVFGWMAGSWQFHLNSPLNFWRRDSSALSVFSWPAHLLYLSAGTRALAAPNECNMHTDALDERRRRGAQTKTNQTKI